MNGHLSVGDRCAQGNLLTEFVFHALDQFTQICTSLVCTGTRGGSHRVLRVRTSLSSAVKWAKERLSDVERCMLPSFHGQCPCCWRPLQCELLDDGKLRDQSSSTCDRAAKRAYVVAVWGSSLDLSLIHI